MSQNYNLSVVIPVFNAEETIASLTTGFLDIASLRTEVILVEDCSADASADILRDLAGAHENVTAIYHENNSGAGIARNTGFSQAKGRYTLFFDADDLVHGDVLSDAVAGLDECGADLAMMPYFYRRDITSSHDAMNLHDADVWSKLLAGTRSRVVQLNNAATLLGFSNYPWNKVIRTDVYRDAGLRYGKTIVNNDILGHWYSLLFAKDILLLDAEICTHIVEAEGENLTNRHSQVRLSLFDALDETYDMLEANSMLRGRYAHHYWALVVRVSRWAFSRIQDDMKPEFNHRYQQHLMRLDLEDFARIRQKRAPALANDLLAASLA